MPLKNSRNMLEYLDKLLTYNNFTKAANALYISQPYLTQVIKKVEVELGVAIINRHSQHFQLTEAGQIYYQYLERLESESDTLTQDLARFKSAENSETIKIGVLSTLGSSLLPLFLPNFLNTHPSPK